MLRPIKKSKDSQVRADLHHLQLDSNRSELDRCKSSPLYFYNTYIRKEGQPIMSEDEFREYQRVEMEKRHGKRRKPERTNVYLNIIDDGDMIKEIESPDLSLNKDLHALADNYNKAKEQIFENLGIPEDKIGTPTIISQNEIEKKEENATN